MFKTDATHLVPAMVFGGLLGVILLGFGASLLDALLVVSASYGAVSLLEDLFDTGPSTSAQDKS